MTEELADEKNSRQKAHRLLNILWAFCSCVTLIGSRFGMAKSRGLAALHSFFRQISESGEYKSLHHTAQPLVNEVENVKKDNALQINPDKTLALADCDPAENAALRVRSLIAEVFGLSVGIDYSVVDPVPFGHLENQLLALLEEKHPRTFEKLLRIIEEESAILRYASLLTDLYRECLFYTVLIRFFRKVREEGIPVCKPVFSDGLFAAEDCTCLALAARKLAANEPLSGIVANDVYLPKGSQFLLSGPNQGGKTVYLKSIGLTALLAQCGCFVLCRSCEIPFYDGVYTHFIKNEVLGKGKLAEEIERMEQILDKAASGSLVLLNESFATTRRKDGRDIAVFYLTKLKERGCTVGFVSHYYEIPGMAKELEMVPLSCGVDDKEERTYKVQPYRGSGFAYARTIAMRTGMTYDQLVDEIKRLQHENG